MNEAVVNEGLIRGLVNDGRARSKFRFLALAHKRLSPSKRSCCGRAARSSLNIRAVKLTVLGMSNSELQKLKDHVGVQKFVFFMPDKNGATVRVER